MKNIYRCVALSLAALCAVSTTPCRAASAVIYKFQGGADGKFPLAGLLEYHGAFYGTTAEGGDDGYGTAFKLTPPPGCLRCAAIQSAPRIACASADASPVAA